MRSGLYSSYISTRRRVEVPERRGDKDSTSILFVGCYVWTSDLTTQKCNQSEALAATVNESDDALYLGRVDY